MRKRPEYYYSQSAVLPYKKEKGEYSILLITSRNKRNWVIPKGIIEIDLSPRKSAEKEAFEEAGIKGVSHKKNIGSYEYKKWGGKCEVEVFPLEVKNVMDIWPEMHLRKRKWFAVKKALKKLNHSELEKIIKKYFKKNSIK